MRYNREREQTQFVDSIILKLPRNWAKRARAKHEQMAKISLRDANVYLLDLKDAINGAIDVGASDDDLVLLAVDCVDRVRVLRSEQLTRSGVSMVFNLHELLEDLCLEFGVRYPVEHDLNGCLARLSDSAWWLRALRVAHAKRAEGAAIGAGLVSKRAGVYCSDDTLERRAAQRARNIKTLEGIDMVNTSTGEVMNLADIAKAGTGNHENRRAELVTRVRGFEELAHKYKHKAEFVTLTCPSRMHAVLSNGKDNPKYDGTKPDAAQKYLVDAWARTRAKFAREGIKVYGLRIAEPHHDATPHWHMILFFGEHRFLNVKYKMRAAFKEHFIYDEGFENLTAQEKKDRIANGVKFVSINAAKGTASGYVLKYVLKNIGGIEDEKSDEANTSSESLYPRVEAWAACWRIRQFQQIGGHYVSVWRELRRVDACKLEGKKANFVRTWQACQKVGDVLADFAGFIEGMGGLDTKPRKSLFKVGYDFTMGQGRYGETVLIKVLGVEERFGREVVATNRDEWRAI